MRVLIVTVGSGGDVHPYIAIARELRAQGHEPIILANPVYAARIRAESITFEPLGDAADYQRLEHDPRVADGRRSASFILNQMMIAPARLTFERTAQAIEHHAPDVLLRHHPSIGSRWAAESAGIPVVTGVLAPCFFFSRHEPVIIKGWPFERAPRWVRRLRLELGRATMRLAFDRPLNRTRRSLRLPRARDLFFDEIRAAHAVLGLWSPALRPALPDDPAQATITGFCFFDQRADTPPSDPALDAFLDRGPPIVFSLGTIIGHHGRPFFRGALDAANILRRPAIILGTTADRLADLLGTPPPPHVLCTGYLPFSRVLPRAACLVHHGGIGTMAQCLRAGLPMVIVPHIADQFDHAARVKRLGIGTSVAARNVSGPTLAAAINAATRLATSAKDLSSRLTEDGPAAAVAVLERIAHQRPA